MASSKKKGKTIHSEARNIIKNIIAECDEESRQGRLKHLLSESNKRASTYAGKSVSTISRIRKETIQHGEKSLSTPGKHRKRPEDRNVHLDDFNKRVIRDIIHEFYVTKKIVPTCPKLLDSVKKVMEFPWGVQTLRHILRGMGYKWKKCGSQRRILIEKPHIFNWRCKYLRTMRQHWSQKRAIVFIDETWVDSNLTFNKCWQSETETGIMSNTASSNRLIITHAGSNAGFLQNALLIFKVGQGITMAR